MNNNIHIKNNNLPSRIYIPMYVNPQSCFNYNSRTSGILIKEKIDVNKSFSCPVIFNDKCQDENSRYARSDVLFFEYR
jgi:hypothetical protein